MAEKKPSGKDDMSSDSGLGNLPPLSDFDSKGSVSDAGLTPLGGFDSPMSDEGGLPPISDIDVETPQPTGGNIKAAPPGFESKVASTFSSGPRPGGTGFQDLAADSDFSPETPEIGPGPGQDSPMDTPMFDSAFGGGPAAFDTGMRTPAPTQAMETPMFGGSQGPARGAGGGLGFDQGAFGGGMDFGGGTPAPDFSPDTDMQPAMAPVEPKKAKAKKSGGKMAAVITLVAGLIIGILVGPLAQSYLPFDLPIPNPVKVELAKVQAENKELNKRLQQYINIADASKGEKVSITKEERDKLEQDIIAKKGELNDVTGKLDAANKDLTDKQSALTAIEQDINKKTEEFVTAQEQYEDLQNETAIIQARQKGLVSEVDRLTGMVGQLDEANQRSAAVKEAFAHNVDRLIIQIKEGIPLTPAKYSSTQRLAAAEELRDKVSKAKWVEPALQQEYTALYLKELEIAASNDYFFAKVIVKDQFNNVVSKWAECLMQGNWGVYFRTFDGRNIGVYENIGNADAPNWVFKEDFTSAVRKDIEGRIAAARVPGYEEKIKVLTEKQMAQSEGTSLQKNFDSL